jgi:hypothetical protein
MIIKNLQLKKWKILIKNNKNKLKIKKKIKKIKKINKNKNNLLVFLLQL